MLFPQIVNILILLTNGLVTFRVLKRLLSFRRVDLVCDGKHDGRVVEQIPLGSVAPIPASLELRGDAEARRTQDNVDRLPIRTRLRRFVPQLRVLRAILFARFDSLPERSYGVLFDEGVVE